MPSTHAARLCAGIACLLLSACASAPKERFYTLSAPASAPHSGTPVSAAAPQITVAVGPIRIPEMVDRPQFVVRRGPNQVEVLEQHRWAQSLRSEVSRVVTSSLSEQLPAARVMSAGEAASQNAEYRVSMDIEQFDAMPGDAVLIQALWTVRRTTGNVSTTARSTIREPVQTNDYDALAAAYSRALSAMSKEMAHTISTLQSGNAR